MPSTAPWSASVPAARTFYTAETAWETALFAIHFPTGMAADVSAVTGASNTEAVTLGAFIAAPSQTTSDAFAAAATAGSAASNAIRRDLGLPPAPLPTP